MSNIVFIETSDDKGIALKVTFDGIKYKVEVSKGQIKKEAFVSCSFTPTFWNGYVRPKRVLNSGGEISPRSRERIRNLNKEDCMIIKSLLDTDFYKFTMQQVAFSYYPKAEASFKFIVETRE